MGTNYYLHTSPKDHCSTCGRHTEIEPTHIGKTSLGWRFLFNGVKFKSFMEVLTACMAPDTHIEDEYGRQIGISELLHRVFTSQELPSHFGEGDIFQDDNGFEFNEREFC